MYVPAAQSVQEPLLLELYDEPALQLLTLHTFAGAPLVQLAVVHVFTLLLLLQFASQLVFPFALVVLPLVPSALPHTVQLVWVPTLDVYEPIGHWVQLKLLPLPVIYDPAFALNAVLALAVSHVPSLLENFFNTPLSQ